MRRHLLTGSGSRYLRIGIFVVVTGLVAAALFTLAFTARIMALTVQDRIIRLEMRLRMNQVLPAELCARVDQLTRQQLVAPHRDEIYFYLQVFILELPRGREFLIELVLE